MRARRLDEEAHAGQLALAQRLAEGGRLLGGDAASAPVGDAALGVQGTEVAASGHVLRLEVEVDAERLEYASAHGVAQRVVAEEGEVAGAAPGRDAMGDGYRQAAGALGSEAVEVGSIGGLKLAAAGLRTGQPAQAVDDGEHDLRLVWHGKLANEV